MYYKALGTTNYVHSPSPKRKYIYGKYRNNEVKKISDTSECIL